MFNLQSFLDPSINAFTTLLEQLNDADTLFECYRPDIDLSIIQERVLQLALANENKQVRMEALRVLTFGLVHHPEAKVGVRVLAEKLAKTETDELSLALEAIEQSEDQTLADYVRPFLNHENTTVRLAALSCLMEFGLIPDARGGERKLQDRRSTDGDVD
jgi:hypothetical protein